MSTVHEHLEMHRRGLWGLCYRMTGSAADADDLVQETFVRALVKHPEAGARDLRPWLVTVAMNLSRDALRRRKRAPYIGPWLPSPVETGELEQVLEPQVTTGRYELMESVSYAFLVAIEVLTEKQRAVFLLRDVFDYSVRETAAALGLSDANVKTTLHRARAAMADYDRSRQPPTPVLRERTQRALAELLTAIAQKNYDRVGELVDAEVVAYSDGGGEFFAARVPIRGRDKVVRFYRNVSELLASDPQVEVRDLNGTPALLLRYPSPPQGVAERQMMRFDFNEAGVVVAAYAVLASRKLARLHFPG